MNVSPTDSTMSTSTALYLSPSQHPIAATPDVAAAALLPPANQNAARQFRAPGAPNRLAARQLEQANAPRRRLAPRNLLPEFDRLAGGQQPVQRNVHPLQAGRDQQRR